MSVIDSLGNDFKNTIEQLFNFVKSATNCIGIKVMGSLTIPYLDFHRDVDVLCIVENENCLIQCVLLKKDNEDFKNIVKGLKENYNANVLFRTVSMAQAVKPYSYEIGETICGENIDLFVDVFSHQDEYMNACATYMANNIDLRKSKQGTIYKGIYHILTVKYFLENNSYELTEAQLSNIKLLHDMKEEDNERVVELYNEVKEWVENYETVC